MEHHARPDTTREVAARAPHDAGAPRVSVLIPVYNTAPYVADTLRSVFAQTCTDYEVVVVDDGSTDGAGDVVRTFGDRVRCSTLANGGVSRARNHGLGLCRGDVIAFLDSDDLWEPDYLERMLAELDRDGGADLVYPDAVMFGTPRLEGAVWSQYNPTDEAPSFRSILARTANVFVSCVARTEVLRAAGGFDTALATGEDWDLWLRVAYAGGRLRRLDAPLVHYRQRDQSLSASDGRIGRGILQVCDKWEPALLERGDADLLEVLAAQRSTGMKLVSRHAAKHALQSGDYVGVRRELKVANRADPSLRRLAVLGVAYVAPGLLRRRHLARG